MRFRSTRIMRFGHKAQFTIFMLVPLFSYQLLMSAMPVFANNDFVDTELRVDIPATYNAQDYQELIYPVAMPAPSNSGYTTGWLGLNLAQFNGTTYSAQFIQIGILTDGSGSGPRWFIYAEPGVQCLQGAPWLGTRGCLGNYNDRVKLGAWRKVELVTYNQGFWILRLYDQFNNPIDVAKVFSTSLKIYRAFAVTEEAWTGTTDPHLTASFHHYHPQYHLIIGGWQEWPGTTSAASNYVFTSPASVCPSYMGVQPSTTDHRLWYQGSFLPPGAPYCTYNPLF